MKKWQENRNYRHIYDSDGNVTENIITADDQDVAVSEEVFLAYSQADRRERYIEDEVEPGKLVSLEKLMEDHLPLERCGVSPVESAEEELIQLEEMELWMRRQRNLGATLSALSEREQELIHSLYYEGGHLYQGICAETWNYTTCDYKAKGSCPAQDEKIF